MNDKFNKEPVMAIQDLLEMLATSGGKIVSTGRMHPDMIAQAQASNRIYVDGNGLGYVWEPPIAMMPTTPEELEMWEKCYPLPVEVSERLINPQFIIDKLNSKGN